ncbi:MAG: glycosyltransferase [Candidatus Gastranaerophilales bacterium]|nr:glycosyltransferase [Candidatus Gastranaerophilales bacterium]
MKILAIPRSNDKKYSFELFELLRHYQNEVVTFIGGSKIPDIEFFSVLNRIKDPFIFENELIAKKLEKVLSKDKFNFVWNLGLNREYLPYITEQTREKNIRLIQTVPDDAIIVDDQSALSYFVFGNSQDCNIDNTLKFYEPDIDLFIVHSRFMKNLMIQAGVEEEKLVHIPIFVDAQKYTPYYKSEDYFVYKYAKSDKKDLLRFLRVMERLPKHKMIIIGHKEDAQELDEILDGYKSDNILRLCNLNQAQKQQIVQLARFILVLSHSKQKQILESYAIGKPVLVKDFGANNEYVVSMYSGLLFDNNTLETARKVDYMMKDKEFCRDAGAFARNLVENCFDKQSHYSKIFRSFHSLNAKRRSGFNPEDYLNIS